MAHIPAWWPQVVAAADRRRHVTGLLLQHATPTVVDGSLRLTFTDPAIERAWRDNEAQAALDGALQQHGIAVRVAAAGAARSEAPGNVSAQ